jgi:hypothetical protein
MPIRYPRLVPIYFWVDDRPWYGSLHLQQRRSDNPASEYEWSFLWDQAPITVQKITISVLCDTSNCGTVGSLDHMKIKACVGGMYLQFGPGSNPQVEVQNLADVPSSRSGNRRRCCGEWTALAYDTLELVLIENLLNMGAAIRHLILLHRCIAQRHLSPDL